MVVNVSCPIPWKETKFQIPRTILSLHGKPVTTEIEATSAIYT